jgi:glycosyltransferase involved in cell wall biosynthesis
MSRIAFISTMYGETWGGSEQLWGAAAHVLLKAGHRVAAGVNHWPGPRREWDALQAAGCELHIREYIPRLPGRLMNRFLTTAHKIVPRNATHEWLKSFQPDLVVVCQAWTDDGLEVMEMCRRNGWKYASIVQAASEYQWPDDTRSLRLCEVYQAAAAAFFVSRHNLELTEKQIAARIPRGEIVWNPFSVEHQQPLPWPDESKGFKLACVGRLQPDAKGQDILLQVLAQDCWRDRPLTVTFFGKGVNRRQIERLAGMLGVKNVQFGGFVSGVSGIWKEHHALVLPSRKEGLPIVLLEASLCGRPAICNRTAGVPEVLDDGVTGFLSAAPEVDLFAEALERAWASRNRWREMGLRAAEKVRALVPEKPAETFANRLVQLLRA